MACSSEREERRSTRRSKRNERGRVESAPARTVRRWPSRVDDAGTAGYIATRSHLVPSSPSAPQSTVSSTARSGRQVERRGRVTSARVHRTKGRTYHDRSEVHVRVRLEARLRVRVDAALERALHRAGEVLHVGLVVVASTCARLVHADHDQERRTWPCRVPRAVSRDPCSPDRGAISNATSTNAHYNGFLMPCRAQLAESAG